MSNTLDTHDYYRLPWSLNDNVLSWLEPTKRCNLYCEGCYSRNEKQWDKTLEQIRHDLDVFRANRRFDSVSITGGDPLLHSDIVEIVRIIRHEYGYKPVLNTNGLALTPDLARDLRRAGLFGFTFHVDSGQRRPQWTGKDEIELGALRSQYAEMAAAVGGLAVAFNATVYPETLSFVPDMLEWARRYIDIVHSMVFILFRTSRTRHFDYYANGRQIDPQELIYYDEERNPLPLSTRDIVAVIQSRDPMFAPCAYLGGTKDPQSFKWLIAGRIGSEREVMGYVGRKFMEVMQAGHHLLTGRYLAYSTPFSLGFGRAMMLGGASFDAGARAAAVRYLRGLVRAPWRVTESMCFQSIGIIQPVDMLASGEINMCDGCPDVTVHNDELVWSCRLDERLRYGRFLTAAPKEGAASDVRRRPAAAGLEIVSDTHH